MMADTEGSATKTASGSHDDVVGTRTNPVPALSYASDAGTSTKDGRQPTMGSRKSFPSPRANPPEGVASVHNGLTECVDHGVR